jgi:hypothetical protein
MTRKDIIITLGAGNIGRHMLIRGDNITVIFSPTREALQPNVLSTRQSLSVMPQNLNLALKPKRLTPRQREEQKSKKFYHKFYTIKR